MKNVIVALDKNKGKARAQQYFREICGHYQSEKFNQKHLDESLRTLDDIYDNIHINAIFSKYEGHCVSGDELTCDDTTFQCRALSQVDSQDILDVYIYLLTIGEMDTDCGRVLYQAYYDIWQTAFVDVGRDLLQEYISNSVTHETFAISDSFGPGFFGMPATDMGKFFHILKADEIGARLNSSGVMLPAKSYAGFFLVTKKEESLPAKDCENCFAGVKTCSYCKSGRQPGPGSKLGLGTADSLHAVY